MFVGDFVVSTLEVLSTTANYADIEPSLCPFLGDPLSWRQTNGKPLFWLCAYEGQRLQHHLAMGEWIVKQQVWQGSINYRIYMEPKVMEVWFRFCPFGLVECDQLHSEYRQFCHCFMHIFWINYSDLSRGHPKGNARPPKCP